MIRPTATTIRRLGILFAVAVVGVGIVAAFAITTRSQTSVLFDGTPRAITVTTATSTTKPSFATGLTTSPFRIQIVPPVRDVRIEIDGRLISSDALGRIVVPQPNNEVEITFVGYEATPAVQQVKFLGWSDGKTSSTRRVNVTAPIPMIAIEVLNRIVVAAPPGTSDTQFNSVIGPIKVKVGEPTWVPALRPDHDGLIEYTTSNGQRFEPTPEALWLVRSGASAR